MNEPQAPKILVVDGEDHTRDICCLGLRQAGFAVVTAASAAEALEQVRVHGAGLSLVLLELNLPDMEGEASFGALLRLQPDLHFLLFTAGGDPDAVQRMVETGHAVYLGKPCALAVLQEEVLWHASLHPRPTPG